MKVKPSSYYNCRPVQKIYRLDKKDERLKQHMIKEKTHHTPRDYAPNPPQSGTHNGKSVRIIQMWIPKGLIRSGPN